MSSNSRKNAEFDIYLLNMLRNNLWLGMFVPLMVVAFDFFRYYFNDLNTNWVALIGYYTVYMWWLCWVPFFYKMSKDRIKIQEEKVVLNVLTIDEE